MLYVFWKSPLYIENRDDPTTVYKLKKNICAWCKSVVLPPLFLGGLEFSI